MAVPQPLDWLRRRGCSTVTLLGLLFLLLQLRTALAASSSAAARTYEGLGTRSVRAAAGGTKATCKTKNSRHKRPVLSLSVPLLDLVQRDRDSRERTGPHKGAGEGERLQDKNRSGGGEISRTRHTGTVGGTRDRKRGIPQPTSQSKLGPKDASCVVAAGAAATIEAAACSTTTSTSTASC